jgi:hypothetical protein
MRRLIKKLAKNKDQKGFLKSTTLTMGIKITGTGISFLAQVVLAQSMGGESYGIYTYIITFVNFMMIFSTFGLNTSALRYLPSFLIKEEYGLARGFFRFSNRFVTALSFLCIIGIFVYFWIFPDKHPPAMKYGFMVAALVVPSRTLINQYSSFLRSLKKIHFALGPNELYIPGLTALAVWLYYLANADKLTVEQGMTVTTTVCILVAIFNFYLFRRFLPKEVSQASPKTEIKSWLAASLPLLMLTGFNQVIKQVDIVLLGSLRDTTEAGYYAASAKLVMLVSFGLSVVNFVFAPKISELHALGDYKKLQEMVTYSSRITFICTFPFCLILVLFGRTFLSWYGEEFVEAYNPMLFLVIGQVVNALCGSVGYLMTMTGNQNNVLYVVSGASILSITLNLILIPVLGATGAAISSATALSAWNIILYIIILKKLKIRASIF